MAGWLAGGLQTGDLQTTWNVKSLQYPPRPRPESSCQVVSGWDQIYLKQVETSRWKQVVSVSFRTAALVPRSTEPCASGFSGLQWSLQASCLLVREETRRRSATLKSRLYTEVQTTNFRPPVFPTVSKLKSVPRYGPMQLAILSDGLTSLFDDSHQILIWRSCIHVGVAQQGSKAQGIWVPPKSSLRLPSKQKGKQGRNWNLQGTCWHLLAWCHRSSFSPTGWNLATGTSMRCTRIGLNTSTRWE